MRKLALFMVIGFLAPAAPATEGVREASAPLTRPETGPQHDAAGVVRLRDGSDSLRISGSGRARFRCGVKPGDALPLGAASLRELSGRAFEVRVGGQKVAAGTLPSF